MSVSGGAGAEGRAPLLPLAAPVDPCLVDLVLAKLKSQGIFDQFRKECINDVDTKPAYQNLKQRVSGTVAGFLSHQTWNPNLNKNQFREKLRKHIYDSNFLDQGVERIVDQVVDPKISQVFGPQVEEIVYQYLGLEKPIKSENNSNGALDSASQLQISTDNLLPHDLDSLSPESVKSLENKSADVSLENIKSPADINQPKSSGINTEQNKSKEDSIHSDDSDNSNEEEFESPAFEPLEGPIREEANSKDSHLSGISEVNSRDSNISSTANDNKLEAEATSKLDTQNTNSQLSQVSQESDHSIEPPNSDSKTSNLKTNFKNTFSGCKENESNSNSYVEPMDVVELPKKPSYKFSNDDNSSDARQYFEESMGNECHVESNPTNAFSNNDSNMDEGFYKSRTANLQGRETLKSINNEIDHDSIEDKALITPIEKVRCSSEMSVDSSESNSVFAQNKRECDNKETYSFENKIQALNEKNMDVNDSSNGSTKADTLKENISKTDTSDDVMSNKSNVQDKSKEHDAKKSHKESGNGKNSREREGHSSRSSKDRDKKDDSKHHSRSSHSRHSSSGKRDSDRRHSSSYDKRDYHSSKSSKDSQSAAKDSNPDSKSKDKHGKHGSNGDSKKDSSKERRESSSHKSSHKSSRHSSDSRHHEESRSKHTNSEKNSVSHDSKECDKNKDSKSSTNDKGRSSHHSSSKDRSSSRHSHSDKSTKSSATSKDEKNPDDKKSKSKSSKDDNCSTLGKSSKSRRSTDRDSNDGNNGSVKGSSATSSSVNLSSTQKNKTTSSGENSSNGTSSGQSDSLHRDSVNITSGSYIKSDFDMFQFASMGAIKKLSLSEKSPPKLLEISNKKPVIHIDSQLNPMKIEEHPACIPDQPKILKKPKCASNIYEAMKIIKARKRIDKIEKRKKQEAILEFEKQQNVPKNSSQVYSGISGPELELACMKPEESYIHKESSNETDCKYFNHTGMDRLTHKIEQLRGIILKLETQTGIYPMNNNENKIIVTTNESNGFMKNIALVDVMTSECKSPPNVNKNIEKEQEEIPYDPNLESSFQSNASNEYDGDLSIDQNNIMEIILGNEVNFDSTTVYFGDGSPSPIKMPIVNNEIIGKSVETLTLNKSGRMKRKRASASTSSSSDKNYENTDASINHNNNIRKQINQSKKRRTMRKTPLGEKVCDKQTNNESQLPGSPDSDKPINKTCIDKNVNNSLNSMSKICNGATNKKITQSEYKILKKTTRIQKKESITNCGRERTFKNKFLQDKSAPRKIAVNDKSI